MKFGEFRKYISKIDRVSICSKDTLSYKNYMFISEVPDSFDDMYLYGIGRIDSEFRADQAPDMAVKQGIDLSSEVYPDLSERVPQRHIATYLGIAPESLSRIRGAMKEA